MNMYRRANLKWLRKLAIKLWVISAKKTGWLVRFAFPCEHTHTFRYQIPPDALWYSYGKKQGNIDSLVLEGCYLCGKITMRDWKA